MTLLQVEQHRATLSEHSVPPKANQIRREAAAVAVQEAEMAAASGAWRNWFIEHDLGALLSTDGTGGSKGKDGRDGLAGLNGRNGLDGRNGKDGVYVVKSVTTFESNHPSRPHHGRHGLPVGRIHPDADSPSGQSRPPDLVVVNT